MVKLFSSKNTTHEKGAYTKMVEIGHTGKRDDRGCCPGPGWHLLQYFRHNSGRHGHVYWLLGIWGGHVARWEQGVISKDNKTESGDE